jgi:DNA polymerase III delta subunit
MIYLLHGDNYYLSSNALKEFTKGNYIIIDGESIRSVDEILNSADTFSLFSTKTTTIIKRLFKTKQKTLHKDLLSWLKKRTFESDIIFWEDRKLATTKKAKDTLLDFIATNGKIIEYKPHNIFEIKKWVNNLFSKEKINCSQALLEKIIIKIGLDQFILEGEINKLINYLLAQKKLKVEESDLCILTLYEPDHKIWDLTDAIGKKEKVKAIEISGQLLSNPVDFPMVIGATIKQLVQMLMIKRFPNESLRLKKTLSILPFLYYKTASLASNYSANQLQMLINKFIQLDYSVKNGLIDVRLGFTLLIATL